MEHKAMAFVEMYSAFRGAGYQSRDYIAGYQAVENSVEFTDNLCAFADYETGRQVRITTKNCIIVVRPVPETDLPKARK